MINNIFTTEELDILSNVNSPDFSHIILTSESKYSMYPITIREYIVSLFINLRSKVDYMTVLEFIYASENERYLSQKSAQESLRDFYTILTCGNIPNIELARMLRIKANHTIALMKYYVAYLNKLSSILLETNTEISEDTTPTESNYNMFISSIISEKDLALMHNIPDLLEFDMINKTVIHTDYNTSHRYQIIELYKELLVDTENTDILYFIYMNSIKNGTPPSKCKKLLQMYYHILMSGQMTIDELADKLNLPLFNINILTKTLLEHLKSFRESKVLS